MQFTLYSINWDFDTVVFPKIEEIPRAEEPEMHRSFLKMFVAN